MRKSGYCFSGNSWKITSSGQQYPAVLKFTAISCLAVVQCACLACCLAGVNMDPAGYNGASLLVVNSARQVNWVYLTNHIYSTLF